MTNIGFFKAGSQQHIEQDAGDEENEVERRQSHEAKGSTQGSKGDDCEQSDA